MKRNLTVICAMVLVIYASAACSQRPNTSIVDSASPTPQSPTEVLENLAEADNNIRPSVAEAAENNVNIDLSGIRLVQFDQPQPSDKIAVMTTSMGEIRIRLFPDHAPKAVENFTTLVHEGFYNNKVFHHVAQGFLIQSGAVNSNGTGSRSIFTDANGVPVPYEDEFSMDLWHFRGAVSSANPGARDSNGSQFFIVQAPELMGYTEDKLREAQFPPGVIEKYAETGGAPHMDWNHTIFGMVIEGLDVVDQIAGVETEDSGTPKTPVLIQKIEIVVSK